MVVLCWGESLVWFGAGTFFLVQHGVGMVFSSLYAQDFLYQSLMRHKGTSVMSPTVAAFSILQQLLLCQTLLYIHNPLLIA